MIKWGCNLHVRITKEWNFDTSSDKNVLEMNSIVDLNVGCTWL